MTTHSILGSRVDADLGAIAITLFLGVALIWTTGFANSAALHGPTHDTRHAVVMPCH